MSITNPIVAAAVAFALAFAVAAPVHAVGTETTTTTEKTAYETAEKQIKSKRYKDAIKTLKQLVADEPKNADAWNLYAFASRKNGQFDNAGTFYKVALKLNPKHLGALEYQGELFLDIGQPDNAMQNLAAIKAICGTCSELRELARAIKKAGSS
jgi:Tfp pilus assembly protein PilF